MKDAALLVDVNFEAHIGKKKKKVNLLVLALMTSSFINKT